MAKIKRKKGGEGRKRGLGREGRLERESGGRILERESFRERKW